MKESCFRVDFCNKMAELVCVTVFTTRLCRKKQQNVRNLQNHTILGERTKRYKNKL